MDTRRVIEVHAKATGLPDLKKLTEATKSLETAQKNSNKQAKKNQHVYQGSTRKIANLGHVASNTGYQVQDLAVQIQGGVDPMKAMSQQIPQMLIGFGAIGSAIGVVIALLPTLATLMDETAKSTVSFADATDSLEESLSQVTDIADGLDFSSWNKAWNEATEQVKAARIELLEFNVVASQANLDRALEALVSDVGEKAGVSIGQKLMKGVMSVLGGTGTGGTGTQDTNFADALNIDEVTGVIVQEAVAAFDAGTKSIQELSAELVKIGKTTPGISEEFQTFINDVNRAAESTLKLEDAMKQTAAARDALASGSDLPTSGAGDTGLSRIQVIGGSAKMLEEYKKLQEQRKEAERAANEELKYTQQLFEQAYPAITAYGNALKILEDQKSRGIISQERFNEELEKQKQILAEAQEGMTAMKKGTDVLVDGLDSFADSIIQGNEDIADSFKRMAKQVIAEILKIMAIQAIANAIGGGVGSALNAKIGLAKGGVVDQGNVTAFAKGGVLNGPTIMPLANGAALAGEAGPEAIMPLGRNSKGELGVKSTGMNVTVNNMAPGVEARPRQTDDGLTIDVVMDSVANAIERGGNRLSNSFENTFALGRGRGVY